MLFKVAFQSAIHKIIRIFKFFFCIIAVLMCVDGLLRKRFCGQTQIHLDLERTF